MEVSLSDDQEFFRETTLRFLSNKSEPDSLRSLQTDADGFDPGYWRQGAELGWTSLLISEEHGGGSIGGNGVVDMSIVADAFGRHAAPGPLISTNVVAAAIDRAGDAAQVAENLGGFIAGERVGAWCLSEPAPHDDLDGSSAVIATADDGGYRLSGIKAPVEAGAQADVLLVVALLDGAVNQFLVDPNSEGVTIRPLQSVDLSRRFAAIEFDDVIVPADAVLGKVGSRADDVEHQLQIACAMQVSEMVGAAERVFDMTVEWAFDRYSFGRPLASYQELKHRFADMKMWLESAHALGTALAREVGENNPNAAETASIAKAYCGDYLGELMQDCVQMHGGIGLTSEHDLHIYFRRVAADRATYGTSAQHRRRVAVGRIRAVTEAEKAA
jgi:alkylation response protein AidB-like acyl-CoA dehydrogenase